MSYTVNRRLIGSHLQPSVKQLLMKIFNPHCGLMQGYGFVRRGLQDPAIYTAAVNLCGVHTLLKLPDPGPGAYHCGGTGFKLNEPVIKSIGESVERYAQLISEREGRFAIRFCSYQAMRTAGLPTLSPRYLSLYSDTQFLKPDFPFADFDPQRPLGWVALTEAIHHELLWVPAQCLFVGYQIKRHQQEPWYTTAVTTGTAAHTQPLMADLNALYELIQIDSAMGHWYGHGKAQEIIFDERIEPLTRLLKHSHPQYANKLRFFRLENADLCDFTIACILIKPEHSFPRYAIGLGASANLTEAMYRAYLEAVGVAQLSYTLVLKQKLSEETVTQETTFYDLDSNVAWYGRGLGDQIIAERFFNHPKIKANDLPPDLGSEPAEIWHHILDRIYGMQKKLYFMDLTCREASDLGFVVSRWWSPDLLSLSLPGAPPVLHPRFKDYGGVSHVEPHPYP